jgi:hypothetical protein
MNELYTCKAADCKEFIFTLRAGENELGSGQ